MGKKVKVTTRCGEIHHYEYGQEVETVEIVEEKSRFRDLALLDDLLEKLRDICKGRCEICPVSFGYIGDDSKPLCIFGQAKQLPAYRELS